MSVNAIRQFQIRSESDPSKAYRVMWDGERWYCDCLSWRFNHDHKGEKDGQGRAVPRTCKHTREAEQQFRARGEKAGKVIQPIGPWFEELQEYTKTLVEISRNGKVTAEKVFAFRRDIERFQEKKSEVADALLTADTLVDLSLTLIKQLSVSV